MLQIFLVEGPISSSEWVEINCFVSEFKMYFNLNFEKNEQIEVFSQETYNFQSLANEVLIIAGHEYIKISIFHQLAVKIWLKEDFDLHTNNR